MPPNKPKTENQVLASETKSGRETFQLNQNNKLIPQFKNGRVINIAEKPVGWFQLTEDNEPNKAFANQALMGIQDSSPLSCLFFSKENVQNVQNLIRYNVYLKSGDKKYMIGEQSTIELEVIMRGIFLQYARHLPYKIEEQVRELNNIVLHQCLPSVMSQVLQYLDYLWRVETLPIPIELPTNLSSRGTRLLRSVTTTF